MTNNELIALYFSGKLSEEQRKDFNHLLENDKAFAETFTFHKDLNKAISKEEQDSIKTQLKNFENELANTKTNRKYWLIAASMAFLLAFSSYWIFKNKSIDYQQLYTQHFEPYRNIIKPIVRGEQPEDIETKAFLAYESGKYSEALIHFNTLLQDSNDSNISFYKANVLMQLNRQDGAITILESDLRLSSQLIEKKNWYLALAYLSQNNIEKAKEQLNLLLQSQSQFKRKEAELILKKIE